MATDILGRRFSEMSTDRDRVEESVTEARGYQSVEGYVQEVVSTAPPRISATSGEVVQVVTRRKTITSLGGPDEAVTPHANEITAPKLAYAESVVRGPQGSQVNGTDDAGGDALQIEPPPRRSDSDGPAHFSRTSSLAAALLFERSPGQAKEFPSFYKGSQAGSSVAGWEGASPTPRAPKNPNYPRQMLDTTSLPHDVAERNSLTKSRGQYASVDTPNRQHTISRVEDAKAPGLGERGEGRYSLQPNGAAETPARSRPFGAGRFVSLPQQSTETHLVNSKEHNASFYYPKNSTNSLADNGGPEISPPLRRSVRIGDRVDLREIEPSRLSPIQPEAGYAPVRFVTRGQLRKMRQSEGRLEDTGSYPRSAPETEEEYVYQQNALALRPSRADARGPWLHGGGPTPNTNINRYASPVGRRPTPEGDTRWSRSNSTREPPLSQHMVSGGRYGAAGGWVGVGDEGVGESVRTAYNDVDGANAEDYDTISLASSAHAQYYKDRDRLQEMRESRGLADASTGFFAVPRDNQFENIRVPYTATEEERGRDYVHSREEWGQRRLGDQVRSQPLLLHPHQYATVRRRSGSEASEASIRYNRLGVLRDGDYERAMAGGDMRGTYRSKETSYTRLRDLQRVDLDVEDVAEYLAAMRSLPRELMAVKPSQSSEAFLVVTRGTYLIKYNKKSQPHERFFALRMIPDDVTGKTHPYLVWALHDKSAGFKARLHLSYLMQAVASMQSPNFQRMLTTISGKPSGAALVGPYVGASKCTVPVDFAMSFVFHSTHTYRTVDVVALDEQTFRCWMIVMSYFAAINHNEGGQPVAADDVGTLAPDTPRSHSAVAQPDEG